jgi:hypothetical protein
MATLNQPGRARPPGGCGPARRCSRTNSQVPTVGTNRYTAKKTQAARRAMPEREHPSWGREPAVDTGQPRCPTDNHNAARQLYYQLEMCCESAHPANADDANNGPQQWLRVGMEPVVAMGWPAVLPARWLPLCGAVRCEVPRASLG